MQQIALVAALMRGQRGDCTPALRYELFHSRAKHLQNLP
jgi:hypothetical protein